MPSSKPKAPAYYLMHWHNCLEWLAKLPEGKTGEIVLAECSSQGNLATTHAKARALRESIRQFPGWSPAIKGLVSRDELAFRRQGLQLFACKRFANRPLTDILAANGMASEVLDENN